MQYKELLTLQYMPYETKILRSDSQLYKFVSFYGVDGCYISGSGGVDSTALYHFIKSRYPSIPIVCVKALECKANQKIIENYYENYIPLVPLKSRVQIIKDHGYPIGSKLIAKQVYALRHPTEKNKFARHLYDTGIKKDGTEAKRFKLANRWRKLLVAPFETSNKCCFYMKEEPLNRYTKESGRKPIMGIIADEGGQRKEAYLQTGCNSFEKRGARSWPFGFWTKQDILRYYVENNLPLSEAYGEIIQVQDNNPKIYHAKEGILYYTTKAERTGCDICGFGLIDEPRPHRFDRMQREEPETYEMWVNQMGYGEVLNYIGVSYGDYIWDDQMDKIIIKLFKAGSSKDNLAQKLYKQRKKANPDKKLDYYLKLVEQIILNDYLLTTCNYITA